MRNDTSPGTVAAGADCPLKPLLASLPEYSGVFLFPDPASDAFELLPPSASGKGPGRCRLRVFRIEEGKDKGKWAAFFYKPSAVPHSGDRYSYGAAVFDSRLDAARASRWLQYLRSTFDPELIPEDVRRALTFTLPDFTPAPTAAESPAVAVQAAPHAAWEPAPGRGALPLRPLNPGELEVDLFCRGIRIDSSCSLEDDARVFSRTRAGLGSGLEMVIPGSIKDLWINVPVEEDFAQDSPYRLMRLGSGDYRVVDERLPARSGSPETPGFDYPVRLPHEPAWYRKTTRAGTPMSRVGVLQGTYLGIYISNSCGFWYHKPESGCLFCTTGLNVGVNEVAEKDLADVVDVARAAKEESGNTFVHFNSGYHGGDRNLEVVAPYVKAVKEQVGAMIGVQVVPSPNLWKYDWLIDLGTNHFSFCYEFQNPEYFARYLPGKERLVGQKAYFDALEYCSKRLGKGTCSGEIIAGVEPIEDTLKAIDYITEVGAFPTVCIFRPTIGAAMERHPSPSPADMVEVMRYMYEACRKNGIPIGMAPNIEVSLIVNPEDARYLVERNWKVRLYEMRLGLLRALARPYFAWHMRPRKIKASGTDPSAYRPAGVDMSQPRPA